MTTEIGATCFGAVIGWITYFILRYKKEHAISDLTAIIGTLGGGAVLSLFDKNSGMFSWYAVGLAIGFFGYVILLLALGLFSKQITLSDLLDGSKTKNPLMSS
jgi:uncharacterized membrane protein YeaQ/YmgE (transglycosylase-associated protein family)